MRLPFLEMYGREAYHFTYANKPRSFSFAWVVSFLALQANGINKTWQNKQSTIFSLCDQQGIYVIVTGKFHFSKWGEFSEYFRFGWEIFKLFPHTPTAHRTRFQSKRIAINFTTLTRNKLALVPSDFLLEQIIKCVIKRSWDVGTCYREALSLFASSLRWQGNILLLFMFTYDVCWRFAGFSFEYSISMENLWLFTIKRRKKRKRKKRIKRWYAKNKRKNTNHKFSSRFVSHIDGDFAFSLFMCVWKSLIFFS